jgi:hypothetical protein
MSLFSGIGDFFRGAFGESEEEKRRRKQREAQEAAARRQASQQARQQAQQQPQQNQSKIQQVEQFFGSKPKPPVTEPKPPPPPRVEAPRVEHPSLFNRATNLAGKALDTAAASVYRVGTGVGQGLAGTYDLVTPGKGTNRVSKGLDKLAEFEDRYAREHGVETAYKLTNVPLEVASYFIPSKAAATVVSKAPRAARLTEQLVAKLSNVLDNSGDANRVRQMLAEGARRGMTLEQVLTDTSIAQKYTGEKASRGEKITPAEVGTNAALGVFGGALTQSLSRFFRGGRVSPAEIAGETAGVTAPRVARQAEEQATRQGEEDIITRGIRNASTDELTAAANDVNTPAIERKAYKDELARREAEAAAAPNQPVRGGGIDRPTILHKQDIQKVKTQVENELNNYIAANPGLTRQQIEAAQQAAKERAIKLVTDLQKSREASAAAIEGQGKAIATAEEARQAENAAVAADRAAQTNPNPASVVEGTTVPTNPEIAANTGYRQSTEDILYGGTKGFDEKGRLSIPQLFSPNRIIRENVTRPVENKINQMVKALQQSGNRVGYGAGRLFTGISREAGVTPELQTARMQLRGGVQKGKLNRETIADIGKGFEDESLNRVWATLDPEFAQRAGMQVENLTPEETALQTKLKNIIDNTTEENLRRGLIDPAAAANESYIKRSYSVYDGNEGADKFERGFRTELLGQYKGRKTVSDEMVEKAIKDPTYLVAKKTAESEAMWAMQDYGNYLAKNGVASDVEKVGYTKLPESPVFGDAAGKYIPNNLAEDFTGFQYTNAMVSAMNDLFTAYDRLGIRQAKKQLLTIFNPAVRLGNQATNRGIFSSFNGINPAQFNYVYSRIGKDISQNSQIYREAVEQGLTGIDISQAEFFAKRIADGADDPNLFKRAVDWSRTSYSGADDKARITAYAIHRSRGYSPEEAARMTQRGFQDYKSVGFFYDMAAKTPIIGNAFVRFAGDSVRIAKNAVVDHPLSVLGTIAAWSTFVNGMSVASGESNAGEGSTAQKAFNLATGRTKSDLQKSRESRFGAPKIPFTDISTAVQTPWGEVNVARFMPWYQLNDISESGLSKVLPYQANPLTPQGWNDPLLGQVLNVAKDRDFRGISIRDPGSETGKYAEDPLSSEQQRNNILRYLGVGNLPLGKEFDQTRSAMQGKPDIYGKERSLPQAILRDLGLKVEQQGAKQAETRRETEAYFDEKAQIEKDVANLSPSSQEAYKRLTGYYKLHEQVPNEFQPGDMRDKKAPQYDFSEDKWKELAAHPELYELLVNKKQRDAAEKGVPLQPEYDPRLSEGFRRQLIQNKMVAPGDDAELDQRMYSQPEWDYYMQLKDQYSKKAKQYYPDSGDDFTDELVRHQDAKFPEKPNILKVYSAAYGRYADGKGDKPEFTDAIKAAKEQYNRQTLNWTNKERKARGLPPITWDVWNNPSFGFDESASGFGFGSGGERGVNTLGRLTDFTADVSRLQPIEAQHPPNVVQLFQRLMAGHGGGRAKPKLGAGSRGQ